MYLFLCYNRYGQVIAQLEQPWFPGLHDLPDGTVRVDIAIPFK